MAGANSIDYYLASALIIPKNAYRKTIQLTYCLQRILGEALPNRRWNIPSLKLHREFHRRCLEKSKVSESIIEIGLLLLVES